MATATEYAGEIILCKDGTGTRYLTDVQLENAKAPSLAWRAEQACVIRKEGFVSDLLPKLHRLWPTAKFKAERVMRREVR